MNIEVVTNRIHEIRGHRVMLDFDIAEMFEILTKVLNQSVKRNIERFPVDFMFQLNENEWLSLRSQLVTSSQSFDLANDKNSIKSSSSKSLNWSHQKNLNHQTKSHWLQNIFYKKENKII